MKEVQNIFIETILIISNKYFESEWDMNLTVKIWWFVDSTEITKEKSFGLNLSN